MYGKEGEVRESKDVRGRTEVGGRRYGRVDLVDIERGAGGV